MRKREVQLAVGTAASGVPPTPGARVRLEANVNSPVAARAAAGNSNFGSEGSPDSGSAVSRLEFTSASSPAPAPKKAAEGEEHHAVVPASLAALLHQADKSGNQQAAAPHPVPEPSKYASSEPVAGHVQSPSANNGGFSLLRYLCCMSPHATDALLPSSPGAQSVSPTPLKFSSPAANGRGGAGNRPPDTPSRVLSPTSLTARSSHEVYQHMVMTPWGSKHPGVPTGVSGVPETPARRKARKQRDGRSMRHRPHPPPGKINNVRRLSSYVGEGPLLGPVLDCDRGKPCLVLDLDETLVHSSFKPVPNPDYVIPVEIDGTVHHVYVCKRPGCDLFLERLHRRYELVVFTASLAKYADPLLDLLDTSKAVHARLFREACVFHQGNYVKDLSLLGRPASSTIIVDNSPASYLFQPENALPCDSFIDDMNDRELFALMEFLELIHRVRDVRQPLQQWTAGTFNGLEGIQVLNDDEGWTSSEDDEDDSASAAAPSDTATQTEVQTSMASNTMRT